MYKPIRSRLLATTVIYGALTAFPVAFGAMMLTTPALADGYTNVDITGTVTDTTGKEVANATVTLTSTQGSQYHAKTNKNGTFQINQVTAGRYSVSIRAAGMEKFTDVLTTGTGSSSFGFTLSKVGEVETVVVQGSGTKAIANFQSTDVGISVNVDELSNQIPLGRSVAAAIQMAPGAGYTDSSLDASGTRRSQSTSSLAGASGAESAYYINGLNVTDQRTLMGYAQLPYDMMQTVDTKTGGYSAEFGRATGGVVNVTTRSGTNEWHMGAGAYFEPNALFAKHDDVYYAGGTNSVGGNIYYEHYKSSSNEESFYIGGPLLKDHIFMFANFNPRQSSTWGGASYSNPSSTYGTQYYSKNNSPRWGAKFDFVLNENHKLEYTIFSDKETTYYTPYNVSGREDSVITPVDGTTNADGSTLGYHSNAGGINHILKYTGRFTDWFTLSALWGQVNSDYTDGGDGVDMPGIYDYAYNDAGTGYRGYQTLGRYSLYDLSGSKDTRNTYRVDADFYFKAYGDHHIRVGYDMEKMKTSANEAYSGGAIYYTYSQAECSSWYGVTSDSGGCIEELIYAHTGKFKATQSAFYLEDNWQVLPTLSLKLGVRDDIYNYKNASGESYLKTSKQWAPRVGFSWDPFSNGTDKFYGSFGDYYLPIAMNTSMRASSGETYTDALYNTERDSDGNLTVNDDGTPIIGTQLGDTTYYSPPGVPDARSVAAKGLDPMYEREILLGYEHNFHGGFFDNWTMGVRWVHRQLMSTIEDTAIGDAVARWCVRTGTSCVTSDGYDASVTSEQSDFSSYFNYVLINPGKAADVYVDLQGDSSDSSDYDPQWIHLTKADLNLPKAIRHYNAITFNFKRPFDGTWGIQGSYTWSESVGNYEGAVKSDIGQADASLTQDFDHMSTMVGAYGALPNDHKHQIKIYGTYSPLPGVMTGLSFIAKSGRPYGCMGYAPSSSYPFSNQSSTPSTWYCPWGDQTSSSSSLDTQQEKVGGDTGVYDSVLVGRGKYKTPWTFTFNLHTAYTYTTDEYGAYTASFDVFNLFNANRAIRVVEQGDVTVSSSGTPGMREAYWGKTRQTQTPRYVRFGIKLDY